MAGELLAGIDSLCATLPLIECVFCCCVSTMRPVPQSYGAGNVSVINDTSLVIHLIKVTIPIRNGSTGQPRECWEG